MFILPLTQITYELLCKAGERRSSIRSRKVVDVAEQSLMAHRYPGRFELSRKAFTVIASWIELDRYDGSRHRACIILLQEWGYERIAAFLPPAHIDRKPNPFAP